MKENSQESDSTPILTPDCWSLKNIDQFKASKAQISTQMFEELELDEVDLQALIRNLQMNGYLDKPNRDRIVELLFLGKFR